MFLVRSFVCMCESVCVCERASFDDEEISLDSIVIIFSSRSECLAIHVMVIFVVAHSYLMVVCLCWVR